MNSSICKTMTYLLHDRISLCVSPNLVLSDILGDCQYLSMSH